MDEEAKKRLLIAQQALGKILRFLNMTLFIYENGLYLEDNKTKWSIKVNEKIEGVQYFE